MKTDVEKKKGFSPEEKKQREGLNVMVILNQMGITSMPKDIAKRMDAYKEHIEEYADQYLEAAVLSELEKVKSAYAEGCFLTENIGEMVQEEEPDWDQVWYHFTQQVVALNKKRFGKADDPTAVDNDIPVDDLDSQIQLSKNADVLSQHCEEAVAANYLLTAPMFKFGQPHNMVAELANKWYNILLAKQEIEQPFKFRVYYNMKEKQMMPASDNGTHSGSSTLSIPMQSESPPPTPVSPLRKIKKGGKTKPGKKRLKGARANVLASLASELIAIRLKPCRLQHPATGGTNEELQYPPVYSNTASHITDQSEPSATARKRVTEGERLAQDAEQYWAAEGSKWQSKKLSCALNL
ncbi:hypothetical protein BDN71DRAFT_1526492 [Pleurotus eryngii]|uniref:Uncharacterized protein n=1 Tax=Pleurotus eryngii TaxID=5323 RepID=A0A9P6DJ90_PLEER|nr:hypothetical protein BDN71DRAFT_1526492 [Pleurotus eryngii]